MFKKCLLIGVFVLCCLSIIACEDYDYTEKVKSGNEEIETICIDGVKYIRLWSGTGHAGFMSPYFKPDGTLHLCGE